MDTAGKTDQWTALENAMYERARAMAKLDSEDPDCDGSSPEWFAGFRTAVRLCLEAIRKGQ